MTFRWSATGPFQPKSLRYRSTHRRSQIRHLAAFNVLFAARASLRVRHSALPQWVPVDDVVRCYILMTRIMGINAATNSHRRRPRRTSSAAMRNFKCVSAERPLVGALNPESGRTANGPKFGIAACASRRSFSCALRGRNTGRGSVEPEIDQVCAGQAAGQRRVGVKCNLLLADDLRSVLRFTEPEKSRKTEHRRNTMLGTLAETCRSSTRRGC